MKIVNGSFLHEGFVLDVRLGSKCASGIILRSNFKSTQLTGGFKDLIKYI